MALHWPMQWHPFHLEVVLRFYVNSSLDVGMINKVMIINDL